MNECWIILRKGSGTPVTLPFGSAKAAQDHIDGLGDGRATPDNEAITSKLEVKRFVVAQNLEDV